MFLSRQRPFSPSASVAFGVSVLRNGHKNSCYSKINQKKHEFSCVHQSMYLSKLWTCAVEMQNFMNGADGLTHFDFFTSNAFSKISNEVMAPSSLLKCRFTKIFSKSRKSIFRSKRMSISGFSRSLLILSQFWNEAVKNEEFLAKTGHGRGVPAAGRH